MKKQMAIMKGVSFGVYDRNHAMLTFTAYLSENEGCLLCISGEQAIKLIDKHLISDIKTLEGKPCWVDVSGDIVEFVDFFNL